MDVLKLEAQMLQSPDARACAQETISEIQEFISQLADEFKDSDPRGTLGIS